MTVKTNKDIYFWGENITALGQLASLDYGIENANLHLQIVDPCRRPVSYHFSTWDGSSWVERGLLHYSNDRETKLIDLSDYLPDGSGEYKVRIKHVGVDSALIDYISLIADGIYYPPAYAYHPDTGFNILYDILKADNQATDVLNDEIEILWTGVPPATTKVLLMGAQEGMVNYSCREYIYWQTDIPVTQAANTAVELSQVVSTLNNSGQFHLEGTLMSRTGQVIAQGQYPFSIISGVIGLRFSTDKSIYRPGETVTVTGEVANLGI